MKLKKLIWIVLLFGTYGTSTNAMTFESMDSDIFSESKKFYARKYARPVVGMIKRCNRSQMNNVIFRALEATKAKCAKKFTVCYEIVERRSSYNGDMTSEYNSRCPRGSMFCKQHYVAGCVAKVYVKGITRKAMEKATDSI